MPTDAGEARESAGVDLAKLQAARSWNADLGIASSIAVVRRGYLVAEWYEYGTDPDTRWKSASLPWRRFRKSFDGEYRGKSRLSFGGSSPLPFPSALSGSGGRGIRAR